ncbi:hypothetical protein [Paraburkholderia azotifigens]|uniref:Uncharacterized protein n=1 Tax=Paraburkholderia azotifigens TaxID=2057004 RepID=A0A5C6V818_9BURK|nr:hypothetical protein [Paraburkholderia azotifigens]TXC80596.1 hypothetical protein FRZ40_40785 [Paraburkholderia azotifigens]
MQSTTNIQTPVIGLSTYRGGASELLNPFIGDPCLILETVSPEWSQEYESHKGAFRVTTLDHPETPVLALEMSAGKCYHFTLMDLTDPELCSVLETWIRKGCFVVAERRGDQVAVSGCRLTDEYVRMIEKARNGRVPCGSEAFLQFSQVLIQGGTCERFAASNMSSRDVEPVVEIQVLKSATRCE